MFCERRKSRNAQICSGYDLNPRGHLWKKDEQNFGSVLMRKMGWRKGTGLGKNGTGITEPIRVAQMQDKEGLGYSNQVWNYSWNWLSHQDDYTALLGQLQQQHSFTSESQPSNNSVSKPVAHGIADLEKKARGSRKRVPYQRSIQGKNMKNRSQADWNCILGIKRKKENLSPEPDFILETDQNLENLVIAPVTSDAYFFDKSLKLEGTRNEIGTDKETENDTDGENNTLYKEQETVPVSSSLSEKDRKKRKRKKKNKLVNQLKKLSSLQNEPLEQAMNNGVGKENHWQAEDSLIVLRKAKKKKKKRKKRAELKTTLDVTNFAENSIASIRDGQTPETNVDNSSHLKTENVAATSICKGILKTRSEIVENVRHVKKNCVRFVVEPIVGFVPAKDCVRGGAWIWRTKSKNGKVTLV